MATELVNRLESYAAELDGILKRFTRSQDSNDILQDDDPRFRELVIEVRDLFKDHLPNEDYAPAVVTAFNEGISNFIGTPSFKSVETIRGIVKAALVRVKSNPAVLHGLDRAGQSMEAKPLKLPDKVAVAWLIQHVHYTFWLSAGGALVGAYLLGFNTKAMVKAAFGQ